MCEFITYFFFTLSTSQIKGKWYIPFLAKMLCLAFYRPTLPVCNANFALNIRVCKVLVLVARGHVLYCRKSLIVCQSLNDNTICQEFLIFFLCVLLMNGMWMVSLIIFVQCVYIGRYTYLFITVSIYSIEKWWIATSSFRTVVPIERKLNVKLLKI